MLHTRGVLSHWDWIGALLLVSVKRVVGKPVLERSPLLLFLYCHRPLQCATPDLIVSCGAFFIAALEDRSVINSGSAAAIRAFGTIFSPVCPGALREKTIAGRRQTLLRERDVGSPSCNPSPRFVDELLVVLAWAESAQRHDWCAGENHQPENVGLAVTLQAAGLEVSIAFGAGS